MSTAPETRPVADEPSVVVTDLRAEQLEPALGLGTATPRLSWVVRPAADAVVEEDWRQRGYEVEVVPAAGGDAWRSGEVAGDHGVLVPWPGAPLASRTAVHVRVRALGEDGVASAWSGPLPVETGLLDPADWVARPVSAELGQDPSDVQPPVLLRRVLQLDAPVASARLHLSAHGVTEVELNGRRVGDEVMAPGWTSYDHRLRYRTHDVTALLSEGENVLGAWLADGWYRGRLGFHGGHVNLWGERTALLAQLDVELADGRRVTVATAGDGSWRAAPSPIGSSGLYEGEVHDARRELEGWSRPGFDDSGWAGVVEVERDPATLVAAQGPPVRCTQEVLPVAVATAPSGATVLDFGQNLVGRLRIRVHGSAGDRIRLRHAEVLQDGELYRRPLRGAAQEDVYVCAGGGEEVWEPRFTMHGFRYAEVTGWPGALAEGDVVARVHHSDMRRTGWFTCSDPLLERLHENVVWSMRSNFVDVPTDCPQRDERLGWTGDIQVFAPTASFLYDVSGFLASWMQDVAAEQHADGVVPWYVPEIPGGEWTPAQAGAVWGDVAVLTPEVLHARYGDVEVLRRQYDSARAWVDLVERLAGPDRVWVSDGLQLGDWLDPAAPPEDPADARTDKHLVATAYFARSADALAGTARVLGETGDAERYERLAGEVREAFAGRYRDGDRLTSDAQTAYALAVVFDVLPPDARAAAGQRLAELVREAGGRIATGFAGTPAVCDALSATGHVDAAYELLTTTDCPSWLYTVSQGATTIWERWDSLLPDGTVNPGEMTSFNHYALGAVADWMHRVVAGLAPGAPGWARLHVAPRPGGGLTSAAARHETPRGTASVSWRLAGGRLLVDVQVPLGVRAEVDLPGEDVVEVGAGMHHFDVDDRTASAARAQAPTTA
ncbi:glycoside hydrolase family 78 protein [uncultured Pseudokineococcus sp.]|uniref:glycoside hydrolase family 78 protein n=1 Tax=uncultured Pseudokineococcus sp. TaxID=1642928 RepID=UPI0026113AE8|nr:glycoside hydrolase family 78 protein [uncultured Pseudokineococcus sp.]